MKKTNLSVQAEKKKKKTTQPFANKSFEHEKNPIQKYTKKKR